MEFSSKFVILESSFIFLFMSFSKEEEKSFNTVLIPGIFFREFLSAIRSLGFAVRYDTLVKAFQDRKLKINTL